MLNLEVKEYIEKSVLCWLATADEHHQPNVSPKEIFTFDGDENILIAHIASPKSVQNIQQNSQVCVSFVDIFVQKGFKILGNARLILPSMPEFSEKVQPLLTMTGGLFPIQAIILIHVKKVEPILAPSYRLFPEITEAEQIENAKKTYKVG